MLGLYGIPYSLFFGIDNDEGGIMAAHAWVSVGRVRVTGGRGFRSIHRGRVFCHSSSLSTVGAGHARDEAAKARQIMQSPRRNACKGSGK